MAQEAPLTAEEQATLDSMFKSDEFIKMLGEDLDTSYVEIAATISNGVFSIKNNALNAEQSTTSKILYTPSIGYYHKSGFAISANAFLIADDGNLKFFQYAVSPSYSYSSKKIGWGVSYTRFIKGASTKFEVNPYKNDLYANLHFKKPWLTPSVSMGYSVGRSKEYFDTTLSFPQIPRTVTITDTITTKLSSFSLNFSISHEWSFEKVFSKNDELDVQPYLIVNGSNQKLTVNHSFGLNKRRPVVQQLLKRAYGDGSEKSRFSLQSAAFLLTASYGKGRFIIQPQIYLDYYLHDTYDDRFSALYSIAISCAF